MLLTVFLAAGMLGAFGAFPFGQLVEGAKATGTLVDEWRQTRPTILDPIQYEGSGLVTYVPEESDGGLTLVQGILPGGTQVRLLAEDGRELHRWTTDFFKVWPDAQDVFPQHRRPSSQHQYFTQGVHAFRDGSLLVNFGELGAAKFDRCSRLVWRTDRVTHHSITEAGNGKFWIPGQIAPSETEERLFPPGYNAQKIDALVGNSLSKGYNNSVLLVDADGKVEKEFSVLAAVADAGLEHALYASFNEVLHDPTHLNDIDVVTPALAARIEGVEAGDLLLSLREMNMIAIMDPDDGRLKWHHQGPFVRQHDPDIAEDGMIEIFNNRSKLMSKAIDTSQIVRFDPTSGKTDILFPKGEDDKFYTNIMGAHQKLANGNRLITESRQGRVFEVTEQGRIVWDYRLPYDDEVASLFSVAMRLPLDYFEKDQPTCKTATT